MTPERWQRINQLFESARRLGGGERAGFLARECGGDAPLRREVEGLLASHERAGSFIEEPAIEIAARREAGDNGGASLPAGQVVEHYRVLAPLGAGGMGEVYLAEDTRLGRRVALKFLPDWLATDERRVRRFRREARAASALSHPNIITIHDIGEAEGAPYIASEFVEGETLRARLGRRVLTPGEVLDVAAQVASALAAAHAAGVVHRDVKPENVMLRPDGLVKVLDFGLAKLTDGPPLRGAGERPTSTKADTAPGMLMGTAAYMSPEQARGQEVDGRTDVWSFGCLLYEILAGRPPFGGETPSDTLSLILHREPPPLARYAPEVPPELERIVAKALTKDRDERYQTMKDLAVDLKRFRSGLGAEEELERSAPPDAAAGEAAMASGVRGDARTTGAAAARTEPAGTAATVSSAEYLVAGLRRRKLAAALAAAALVVAALAAYLYYARGGGRQISSLAVLPLVNASGNPEAEYLSDGIAESLINSLSRLPNLRVMSLNSVLRYKGREADARAVGRELGVEAVLTGRLVQRGEGLVVSVELVDARDNAHIWGEQYDRRLSELLAVQGELSRDVLEKLRLRLTGEEERRATRSYTANAAAYQLYLKGRYHWNRRTLDDLWKGVEHFQRAIELDPNYALAYSGLADSYYSLLVGGPFKPGGRGLITHDEAREKSLAAARRAVDLDPMLAEGHTSLAAVLAWFEGDYAGAEREFKRALELNPDYATAHQWYGVFLSTTGRLDEGTVELRRAQQLDPASLPINADLGRHLCNARRWYDQGIEQLQKTIELDPDWPRARFFLAQCYEQKGMYDEAIRETERAGAGWPQLARLYARVGRRDEALRILAEMKERPNSPVVFASVYAALGDKEQAFEWLEKAFAERHPGLRGLKTNPHFDGLRSDPRFADLLRRMGLPP